MKRLTAKLVRSLFDYDPLTGILRRKSTGATGYRRRDGYLVFNVLGKVQKSHRLIWLMVYRRLPRKPREIDHINGDPSDNRLSNLRIATHGQNLQNAKLQRNNALGIRGVYIFNGKYRAQIKANRQQIHLGTFSTIDAAIEARRVAVQKLHGEFARG
jgi:hypothetical protein